MVKLTYADQHVFLGCTTCNKSGNVPLYGIKVTCPDCNGGGGFMVPKQPVRFLSIKEASEMLASVGR